MTRQVQRWKFWCSQAGLTSCGGQHITEPDGEWVKWEDVASMLKQFGHVTKSTLDKLSEIMREQQDFVASEKLAGNVVKEEFHKGALFGLHMAREVLRNR
jgi:hypothetical protein